MVDTVEQVLAAVLAGCGELPLTSSTTPLVPDGQLARLDRLRDELGALGSVLVAFSGGADSAFLAKVATDTLGAERVLCATAVSPSLAPEELADCEALAAEWGLQWRTVTSAEIDDPAYTANDTDRCYHCKSALMDALDVLDGLSLSGPWRVLRRSSSA